MAEQRGLHRVLTSTVAAFLLAMGGGAAYGATAPAAVAGNARIELEVNGGPVAPGRSVQVAFHATVVAGPPQAVTATLTIPVGATYVQPPPQDTESQVCALSGDGRSLTCHQVVPTDAAGAQAEIRVEAGVPSGSVLTFGATATLVDGGDTDPGDDTATADLQVLVGPDVAVDLDLSAMRVRPGQRVTATTTVRNTGDATTTTGVFVAEPALVGSPRGRLGYTAVSEPHGAPGEPCAGDPGGWFCDLTLAGRETRVLTLVVTIDASAAGRQVRFDASANPSATDPDPTDDLASATLLVAAAPTSPPTSPSPSSPVPDIPATTTPTPASAGPELAATGANGPIGGYVLAGLLLVAAGLGTRRRARHR